MNNTSVSFLYNFWFNFLETTSILLIIFIEIRNHRKFCIKDKFLSFSEVFIVWKADWSFKKPSTDYQTSLYRGN